MIFGKKENLTWYKSLVESAHELIGITDLSGSILIANNSLLKAIGLTEKEFTGYRLYDLVHPDDLENTIAVINKLKTSNKFQKLANRNATSAGDYICIEWNAVKSDKTISWIGRILEDGNFVIST